MMISYAENNIISATSADILYMFALSIINTLFIIN